jgi:hypothetical protein
MNKQKVSIYRIIGNVVGDLGIKNVSNSIDDFARWALEAENKIGADASYKHYECEIEVKNRRACLPDNFVYLEGIKLGDNFLNVTYREFRMFNDQTKSRTNNLAQGQAANINTGVTAEFRNDNLGFNFGYSHQIDSTANVFSITNGNIYFNSMQDGNKVGISYQGIELDEEGWPLIHKEHEDAVTHYLMYKYKARRFYEGKLPHVVFKELEQRWYWLCGQARGDSEMPDTQELKYLGNQWNQLLPLPAKQFF